MFNNPGGALKGLGYVIFAIILVLSVLGGIYLLIIRQFFLGVLVIGGGGVFAWLASIFLVAFGELVENSTIIKNSIISVPTTNFPKTTNNFFANQQVSPQSSPYITCPICGAQNKSNAFTCEECGSGLARTTVKSSGGKTPVSGGIKVCPMCKTDNLANSKYCDKCGYRFS